MNCKKCQSTKMVIKINGPHHELRCGFCGAYQKNLTKNEIDQFNERIVTVSFLTHIDSLLSLIRYRYNSGIPDDLLPDIENIATEIRKLYELPRN